MKITLDQLVKNLSGSGLMSAEEAAVLCAGLSAPERVAESEAVIRELAATGKLTSFQAKRICEGQTSGLVFGEYVVLDRIGAGGMGEVFKGRHRTMDREVAIKVLPEKQMDTPDAVKRFHKEVRAAAKLHHPNIVTAHDAGRKSDLHFLVMEYVEGQDLSAIVDEGGPLPVEQAMDVILQAARGLEYAHKRGVYHRDIKPANLLLDNEGTVKILDMGLARVEGGTGAADTGDGLTSTGQIMGTSDYLPPEQAMDTRKADARSDIYSLGCTIYRLVTGKPPYGGDTVMKKIMAHMSDPIPSLREACPAASEPLDELYRRMLAKEPRDRPQTMTEVIATLESILRGQSAKSADDSSARGAAPDAELASFFSQMIHAPAAPSVSSRPDPKTGTARTVTPVKEMTEPVAEETIDLPRKDDTSRSVTAAEAAVTRVPAAQPTAAQKPAPGPRQHVSAQRQPHSRQLLLLYGLGVGLSLIGAAALAVVLYVQTNHGTVVVQTEDNDVEVVVKRGGEVIDVIDAKDKWRVEVKGGEYHVELKGGDDQFALDKDTITVTRGGEVRVRVEMKPPQVVTGRAPPLAIAPLDASQAKQHQQAWAEYLGLPVEQEIDLPGGAKVTMVLIPPGEFLMGSTDQEQSRILDEAKAAKDQWVIDGIACEGPQHRVRITRPFYLGKYEVTQAQWQGVMGSNPSVHKDSPLHPVEQVTWDDIQPFLAKLNEVATLRVPSGKSALRRADLQFVLPTEAQWEYACRAGTTTLWQSGDSETTVGWHSANAGGKAHPVGQLTANPWGLHDMHGNVWEWCVDSSADYYRQSPMVDPRGPATGSFRVIRGGSWWDTWWRCRSAFRGNRTQGMPDHNVGLRLACEIPCQPEKKPAIAESASQSSPQTGPALAAGTDEPQVLAGHTGKIVWLAYSPKGDLIASAGGVRFDQPGNDTTVRLWSPQKSPPEIATIPMPESPSAVAFSPDGATLGITNPSDGSVLLYDLGQSPPRLRKTLTGLRGLVMSIAFSPDGRWVAAGSRENAEVRVWDLTKPETPSVAMPATANQSVLSLAFSPDSATLAAGFTTSGNEASESVGEVQGWDMKTQPPTGKAAIRAGAAVRTVVFAPNGKYLLGSTTVPEGLVRIWDTQSFEQIGTFAGHAPAKKAVISVAVSPDSKLAASCGYEGVVRVWSLATQRELLTIPEEGSNAVESVVFSPDGRWLAFAGNQKVIKLVPVPVVAD